MYIHIGIMCKYAVINVFKMTLNNVLKNSYMAAMHTVI